MKKAATYLVVAEFADESEQTGSGFCIFDAGLIFTCSHVVSRMVNGEIELPTEIWVSRLHGGNTLMNQATITKNGNPQGSMIRGTMTDPNTLDLALLQIQGGGTFPVIQFAFDDRGENDPCCSFGAFENEDEEVNYAVEGGWSTVFPESHPGHGPGPSQLRYRAGVQRGSAGQ